MKANDLTYGFVVFIRWVTTVKPQATSFYFHGDVRSTKHRSDVTNDPPDFNPSLAVFGVCLVFYLAESTPGQNQVDDIT